jgi:hypothetical protein
MLKSISHIWESQAIIADVAREFLGGAAWVTALGFGAANVPNF